MKNYKGHSTEESRRQLGDFLAYLPEPSNLAGARCDVCSYPFYRKGFNMLWCPELRVHLAVRGQFGSYAEYNPQIIS